MATFSQTGVQNALSISSTATRLTVPTGIYASHCIIQVTGANVRWRADGTVPTTAIGIQVAAGSNIEFMDPMVNYEGLIRTISFIADDAGTATLEVAFFSS